MMAISPKHFLFSFENLMSFWLNHKKRRRGFEFRNFLIIFSDSLVNSTTLSLSLLRSKISFGGGWKII